MGSRIALRAGVNDAVYLKRMPFTIEPVDRPRPVASILFRVNQARKRLYATGKVGLHIQMAGAIHTAWSG